MKTRSLSTIFLTILLDLLGFGLVIPFLPEVARQHGASAATATLLGTVYSLMQFLMMPVWGRLSDRVGRRPFLLAAYVLYAAVYAALAWSGAPWVVGAALALYGVHSALIEVSQRSLLADLVGAERRGTVYGIYHTVVGLALLPASVLAGVLWDGFGARVTFAADAALGLAAALLFAALLPQHGERRDRAAAV